MCICMMYISPTLLSKYLHVYIYMYICIYACIFIYHLLLYSNPLTLHLTKKIAQSYTMKLFFSSLPYEELTFTIFRLNLHVDNGPNILMVSLLIYTYLSIPGSSVYSCSIFRILHFGWWSTML
jgi:hypothetical protein